MNRRPMPAELGVPLRLRRDLFTQVATFGVLTRDDNGDWIAETVERDRDHNRASTATRGGACIPAGTYLCRRVKSQKHGIVFEVTGVSGRLYIQIHAANWSGQLRGCIAPGLARAIVDDGDVTTIDDRAVTESKKAMKKLMELQQGFDAFWLTIIDAIPESS